MNLLSRLPHLIASRRVWACALMAGGVPLLLLSWVSASSNGAPKAEQAAGGRYVEGVIGPAPERINPLFASSSGPEADLTGLIFSGLTRPGPNGEPEPDLAVNWVASVDGTTFTFDLRRDVLWHDGQPFTADDVVFTAGAFAAPGVKGDPATAEVWRRAHVSKLGIYTVLFQFDSPYAPFLSYSSAGILPKHLLGNDTPDQLVNDPFNRKPIGTGPFRFDTLTPTGAELLRSTYYYLGVPYLKRLALRFVPDNAALLASLGSHTVDGGLLPPPLTSSQLDALRSSGHTLLSGERSAYNLVYLNLNAAQFQDAAVRQAMSLAIDRNRLVQQVMDGQATAADVPLPPGTWSGVEAPKDADPTGALALLKGDGWVPDAAGTLRRRGIALSFTMQTTSDPQRQAIAAELVREWEQIGIRATVQLLDESALLSDVLLPHKYEAVLFGWDPGPDPDPFPAWHSSQRGEQGRNLSAYANDRADQLLEAARQTADLDARAQIYGAFAAVYRQDVPALVLFFPRYVYVLPQKLQGVRLGLISSPTVRFSGVEGWSIEVGRH